VLYVIDKLHIELFQSIDMKILDKLLQFIETGKSIGRQPYYIVDFLGNPLLIRKNDLISSISRTYSATRDNIYLELPDELLSKELKRVKDKLNIVENTPVE